METANSLQCGEPGDVRQKILKYSESWDGDVCY